ncbi:dUTP diphosphatase [Vibrio owensii]|uniref:dUTP diphosphatase n=1 Tax=Vibrio harveyi group TaxID=717610 RepID=UPI003CC68F48
MIKFGVFRNHEEAKLPERATDFAACYDLRLCLTNEVTVYDANNIKSKRPVTEERTITINPGDRVLMPTELIFDIPAGHSIRFHPRSGLSLKQGLTLANCEAVIDEDYIDPSFILLANISNIPFVAKHHERLAQMEIVEDLESEMEETLTRPEPRKSNRKGGLGHSGTH